MRNKDELIILSNLCFGGFLYRELDIKYNNPLIFSGVLPFSFKKILNEPIVLSHKINRVYNSCDVDFGEDKKYVYIDYNQVFEKKHLHILNKSTISDISPSVILDNGSIVTYPHYSTEEVIEKYNKRLISTDFNKDNIIVIYYVFPYFKKEDIENIINMNYNTILISTVNLIPLIKNSTTIFIQVKNLQSFEIKNIFEKYKTDIISGINNFYNYENINLCNNKG